MNPNLSEAQFKYLVDVGFTTSRPVKPDEHMSRVQVLAGSDHDAHLTALHMVSGRPGVVMPTSSKIHEVEL
jgi:hypothetical protein